ncbi:MAG: hypothetical protein WBA57_27550 [Elainellaceae cyanobacterium]
MKNKFKTATKYAANAVGSLILLGCMSPAMLAVLGGMILERVSSKSYRWVYILIAPPAAMLCLVSLALLGTIYVLVAALATIEDVMRQR